MMRKKIRNEQESAARIIQKNWRCYWAAKSFRRFRDRFLQKVVTLQRWFRVRRLVQRRIKKIVAKKGRAVTQIARFVRGWLVRKNLRFYMWQKISLQLDFVSQMRM